MRPIDADAFMKQLEKIEKKKCREINRKFLDGFDDCMMRVRSMVHSAPILTMPNEWVSVEERLPEKKRDVLILFEGGNMAVGWWHDSDEYITFWCAYTDDGFYTDCDDIPVYWMPLPKPPTEEEV